MGVPVDLVIKENQVLANTEQQNQKRRCIQHMTRKKMSQQEVFRIFDMMWNI
jgi:hypothetical protein